MSEKFYDRHHILPKSKNWSNNSNNLVSIDKRKHNALHMLFDNRTPAEQIERILDLSSTALTKEVKSDIVKILNNKELDYWYKKWIYK